MRATAEVRWFLRGPLPEAAVRWFEAVAGDRAWEERTDRYVRTAATDLGVKWREGRVEAKRRTATLGEARLADEAAGRVERWRKWSYPTDEAAPATDDWVAVHKRRMNRPFAVEDGVRPIESEADAEAGCSLEVSEARVAGAVWWSICFEAWGTDEAALPDALRRTAAQAFGGGVPIPLPAARAMGYPAWLTEAVPAG
ncbi:MAG: hypothetical protein R3181_02865 [Rubricoccaceae bacterium]|nr:hypothetical protein [Rubricoccaceae bacterium]